MCTGYRSVHRQRDSWFRHGIHYSPNENVQHGLLAGGLFAAVGTMLGTARGMYRWNTKNMETERVAPNQRQTELQQLRPPSDLASHAEQVVEKDLQGGTLHKMQAVQTDELSHEAGTSKDARFPLWSKWGSSTLHTYKKRSFGAGKSLKKRRHEER